MKKLFPFFLTLLLCGCAILRPEEAPPVNIETLSQIGTSGYFCVTEEKQEPTESDGINCAVFFHKVYDPDAEYLTTLTVTILGSYDESTQSASIPNISVSLSDDTIEGLSTSQHLSGDTATVILYRNQMSVCHFQYRVYPDGTISLL